MSSAIEVLKKEINEYECVLALDDVNFAKVTNKDKKLILELINSHKKALLALEKQEKVKEILAEPNAHKKDWILAELIHNEYERLAKENNWKTQESCQVKFEDLPTSNRIVMVGIARYIIGLELIARDIQVTKFQALKVWLEKEIELRKIKHDCIAKQAYKSSEDLFRIGELETEVTSLKEVLERVGEQK